MSETMNLAGNNIFKFSQESLLSKKRILCFLDFFNNLKGGNKWQYKIIKILVKI